MSRRGEHAHRPSAQGPLPRHALAELEEPRRERFDTFRGSSCRAGGPPAEPGAGAKGRQPRWLRQAAATPAKATPVRAMLERMVGAENQVDKLLHAAATGKTFSPAELLALQSTVFRYSQTVEVVSRVADRMVGAIKQTLGTNV